VKTPGTEIHQTAVALTPNLQRRLAIATGAIQCVAMTCIQDEARLADAMARVKAEYLEMPGLQLTVAQAARLWQFDREFADAVLTALVASRFLVTTPRAAFARA
jgi:hypothetical protein